MCEIERMPVNDTTQDVLDYRAKMIENLQEELKEAGTLCQRQNADLVILQAEKAELQERCSQLLDKQYQDNYKYENTKKMFENVNKTLERYEAENKALRELVKLWI